MGRMASSSSKYTGFSGCGCCGRQARCAFRARRGRGASTAIRPCSGSGPRHPLPVPAGEEVAHGGEHVVGVQGRLEVTQREIVAGLVAARDVQRFQRTEPQQQLRQRSGQRVLVGDVQRPLDQANDVGIHFAQVVGQRCRRRAQLAAGRGGVHADEAQRVCAGRKRTTSTSAGGVPYARKWLKAGRAGGVRNGVTCGPTCGATLGSSR